MSSPKELSADPLRAAGRALLEGSSGCRLAMAAGFTALTAATYYPTLRYRYVQDDWGFLTSAGRLSWADGLAAAVHPHADQFFRPLAQAYFLVLAKVGDLDSTAHHWVAVGLLALAALGTSGVLRQLGLPPVVAVWSAALYAAAGTIHLDPMSWASGIQDLAAAALSLGSALLLGRRRPVASAVVFALGLAAKEAIVFLPAALLLFGLLRGEGFSAAVRAVKLHGLVLIGWAGILGSTHAWSKVAGDPYYVDLSGSHLPENFARYLRWGIEGLAPAWHPHQGWALAGLGALWLVGLALDRDPQRIRVRLVLAGWLVLAVGPVLVLPNHAYRYYFTYALPAFLGLAVLSAWQVLARLLGDRWARLALATLALASAASSLVELRRIDREALESAPLEGTNGLSGRAATVELVSRELERPGFSAPRGAKLVFVDVDLWAFEKNLCPRLWTGDPTLEVYDARYWVAAPSPHLENHPESQYEAAIGAGHRVELAPASTVVYRRVGRHLERRPFTELTLSKQP